MRGICLPTYSGVREALLMAVRNFLSFSLLWLIKKKSFVVDVLVLTSPIFYLCVLSSIFLIFYLVGIMGQELRFTRAH